MTQYPEVCTAVCMSDIDIVITNMKISMISERLPWTSISVVRSVRLERVTSDSAASSFRWSQEKSSTCDGFPSITGMYVGRESISLQTLAKRRTTWDARPSLVLRGLFDDVMTCGAPSVRWTRVHPHRHVSGDARPSIELQWNEPIALKTSGCRWRPSILMLATETRCESFMKALTKTHYSL